MKWSRVLATTLAASACMFMMPLSANATEPTLGQVIDGSLLTQDESAEETEWFVWDFSDSDVMPLGDYFAMGKSTISKQSSTSAYISGTTECYEICPTVKVTTTLQRLENSTWKSVTSRSKTENNAGSAHVNDTISVKSGYYYRVISSHSATKNGKTETGTTVTKSLYIG